MNPRQINDFARTFFALPVPDLPRRGLIEAQLRMKRAHTSRLPVRFTSEHQLHATLKFCGNVSRQQIPELCAITELHAAHCPAIDTRLSGVITFGRPTRARALVAAIDAHPALDELARALESALEPLGIAREERAFRPHVTLARIKRPGDVRHLIEAAKLEPLALRFDELCCYESKLGSDGSVYTLLKSSALACVTPAP